MEVPKEHPPNQMKKFTIRAQGPHPKTPFTTAEAALAAATNFCQDTGRDVAVIEHDGDVSRLVHKVSQGIKATA